MGYFGGNDNIVVPFEWGMTLQHWKDRFWARIESIKSSGEKSQKVYIEDMAMTLSENKYVMSVWLCVNGRFTAKPHWDRVKLVHILFWFTFCPWVRLDWEWDKLAKLAGWSPMDLPVKWHFFGKWIRHEIGISRKCLGHVINITFWDPLLALLIDPMRLREGFLWSFWGFSGLSSHSCRWDQKLILPPEQYAYCSTAIKDGKFNEDLKKLF